MKISTYMIILFGLLFKMLSTTMILGICGAIGFSLPFVINGFIIMSESNKETEFYCFAIGIFLAGISIVTSFFHRKNIEAYVWREVCGVKKYSGKK